MRHAPFGMLALLLTVAIAGCSAPSVDPAATRPRLRKQSTPAGNNWPISPLRAQRLFSGAPIQFHSAKQTDQGVAGAFKAEVVFAPDPRPVTVKWKVVPADDMDNWNNNARKEVAAYMLQKWFLEESKDYVVPTTAVRCVPLDAYHHIDPAATATVDGTSCVLGTLSLWLEHVTVPETVFDPERFARDYRYAYYLANFNVLAYLIRHRDGRQGNILVADDDANRRVFAIDNGISFDGLIYNFLVPNWDELRVPAIPHDVLDELRDVEREDLDELGTLVELRADPQGVLRQVKPTAPIDPDTGVRVEAGRLQMGLTRSEIDGVERRLHDLLKRVDQGTLGVF